MDEVGVTSPESISVIVGVFLLSRMLFLTVD